MTKFKFDQSVIHHLCVVNKILPVALRTVEAVRTRSAVVGIVGKACVVVVNTETRLPDDKDGGNDDSGEEGN